MRRTSIAVQRFQAADIQPLRRALAKDIIANMWPKRACEVLVCASSLRFYSARGWLSKRGAEKI
jgi:hypothetical protein